MSKDIRTPDEADFQEWIRALTLKIEGIRADIHESIRADIRYYIATTYCSDCPKRIDEDTDYDDVLGFRYDCCKETGSWDAQYEPSFEYINKLVLAQKALKALLEVQS